jgi:protocatechuate 3,4-dioxygenase beta subunit
MGRFSRRKLLTATGAWGFASVVGGFAAASSMLARTPAQTEGPFYPLDKPLDADADLTLIEGRAERAAGQVVHVMGRVLDVTGKPVAGARVEIWQANTYGRYTHPGDRNPAALDPNFEGYANLVADEQGRYRFKTIKPGAYPAGGGMRPPHIHFGVNGAGSRLVTQMYFSGEARNEGDFILERTGAAGKLLIADVGPPTRDLEADSLLARWDIVLQPG